MTDFPRQIGPGSGGEDDLLAAEFVLGTLDREERIAVEARLRSDPAFRVRVTEWEVHFASLNVEYVPLPVPDLMPRIERRLFGTPGRVQGRYFIRMMGILSLGVAAAFAFFFIILGETGGIRPPPAHYAATLEGQGEKLTFSADWDAADGALVVSRTSGPAPADGKSYELWLIRDGGIPMSLGVLRGAQTRTVVPALLPGSVLAVSLEPAGGSRVGKPTGPVLVKGTVARL
ncbi:anti-sigma factor [Acidimangrovimonas sediminis]|uniref:anti-sigma factor n=1 Tax=Acidimangrovimonas sediminis TaxID=2056283 RepID=UPI000C7FA9E8|nr:anti-sigma factor [Acidimangrovimonas sediminis]